MTKFQRTIATAAATVSMLTQVALPVLADDVYVGGNGVDSFNQVELNKTNTSNYIQNNDTKADTTIKISANSGDNKATDNTGGNIYLETGDVDVKANVENVLNTNTLSAPGCGDCDQDASAWVEGNGADSFNKVDMNLSKYTSAYQTNKADVDNEIDVWANSGKNEADDNTGADVILLTGDVDIRANVETTANINVASLGSGNGAGGSMAVGIVGNGADSFSLADVDVDNSTTLTQANYTDIENELDLNGNSGYNKVTDSTGGDVIIATGDVDFRVDVENLAGMNFAEIEDCCTDDLWLKVEGNGVDSRNKVYADFTDTLTLFQNNYCGDEQNDARSYILGRFWKDDDKCFDNDIELDGSSGYNLADDNTGPVESDPAIVTGDVFVDVDVANEGGANSYGSVSEDTFEWPGMGGFDLSISLDLAAVLAYLGLA